MTTVDCENLNENVFDFHGKYDVDGGINENNNNNGNNSSNSNNNAANANTNSGNNNENVIENDKGSDDIDTHQHHLQQQQQDGILNCQGVSAANPSHSTPTSEKIASQQQQPKQQQQQLVEFTEMPCIDSAHHLLASKDTHNSSEYIEETQFHADFDDNLQPLTERWSPLGANYDDTMSANSELISPVSELELLSSDSQAEKHAVAELTRLRTMEDEQEMLTQSLMALTSHFAHVQLRVRQIVEAPADERDQLLRDLEEFAFQGIPEAPDASAANSPASSSCPTSAENQQQQQQRQFELIEQLKSQLVELEKIAYESGAPVLPQHMLLEKQRIIIDELKQKLNLKLEEHDLPVLSSEELKNQVDYAIGEFIGPLKMKDQLVAQLKTQITDLERFIAFLQCDTSDTAKAITANEKFHEAYNSYAAKKKVVQCSGAAVRAVELSQEVEAVGTVSNGSSAQNGGGGGDQQQAAGVRESLNSKAHGLLDKASLLMQMFANTHFGSKTEQFQKNILKKTTKGNHWGDLRAQLEVDIQEVASLAATLNYDREKLANMRRAMKKAATSSTAATLPIIKEQRQSHSHNHNGTLAKMTVVPAKLNANQKSYALSSEDSDDDDDADDIYDNYTWTQSSSRRLRIKGDSINTLAKELTTAVRKNFSVTLQRLIQHGCRVEVESAASSLIVPFMRCLHPAQMHSAERAHDSGGFLSSSSSSSVYGPSYNSEQLDESEGGSGGGGFFSVSANTRPMHAWELILEYYYLKHGDEYNNTPARKLSESFKLDIVEANAQTSKQSLLSTIGMIIAMHRPYKRSMNAHFKAFVCAALNSHALVEWLNLILSCNELIDTYYIANSYVVRTGFRDSLRSIDALTKYDFDLPVDLAIRHFRNI